MIVTTTPWHGACRAAVAEHQLVMFVSVYMWCADFEHLGEFWTQRRRLWHVDIHSSAVKP